MAGYIRMLCVFYIGVNESDQFAVLFDDERFAYIGHIIQSIFDFFRINVLPGRTQYHVFISPSQIYEPIGIYRT